MDITGDEDVGVQFIAPAEELVRGSGAGEDEPRPYSVPVQMCTEGMYTRNHSSMLSKKVLAITW